MIAALGVIQILAWGSSYYLLAVLAAPIAADTGWPYPWVIAGVSLGLLVAGLVSRRVGRVIDARGGRPVLAAAAVLLAAGLAMLAAAPNVPVYLAAWVVLGAGMGAGLYDAAFSTLGRLYGHGARGAITALTLWGGFASTVCWPLSALLVETVGWRGTCLAYAGLHLAVTLPLAWLALPRETPASPPAPIPPPPRPTRPDRRSRSRALVFGLLAVILTTAGAIAALWSVHLIAILQAGGSPWPPPWRSARWSAPPGRSAPASWRWRRGAATIRSGRWRPRRCSSRPDWRCSGPGGRFRPWR